MSDTAARLADLRLLLATIAYRVTRAVQGLDDSFGAMEIGSGARTPTALVGHIADLLELSRAYAAGVERAKLDANAPSPGWEAEVERMYAALHALDQLFDQRASLEIEIDLLLQGPIADALTHVGQLAMMRRMWGDPIPGESFAMADIRRGVVGPDQPEPRRRMG